MEQQLDRRATIGNIYEGDIYNSAYDSGLGERVSPADGPA
jgi:hypothetical protein